MTRTENRITIEAGKRGGKPAIRGMRITVADILGWLASGMTVQNILEDFDELTQEDIAAALKFAAKRENTTYLNIPAQLSVYVYQNINHDLSRRSE
jgi:uncharacterized protein (DUF433 family)